MNDFIACFVCSKNGSLVFASEEFENNVEQYPQNNPDDIDFLIGCVRDKFEFEGLSPIDVCAIIDANTSNVIWEDSPIEDVAND